MKKYLKNTMANKIVALGLATLGYISTFLGDGTFFVFVMMIAVPLFAAKERWVHF
jgi:hypothetical protein